MSMAPKVLNLLRNAVRDQEKRASRKRNPRVAAESDARRPEHEKGWNHAPAYHCLPSGSLGIASCSTGSVRIYVADPELRSATSR